MAEVAPPPPKRPSVIKPRSGNGERGRPTTPARPAPPVPGAGAGTGAAAKSVMDSPVPAARPRPSHKPPSIPTNKGEEEGKISAEPSPVARQNPPRASRPVSMTAAKTIDAVRRRPEITVVAARPMSEVGFRGVTGGAPSPTERPPTVNNQTKPAQSGNEPPVPRVPPRKDSPATDQNSPSSLSPQTPTGQGSPSPRQRPNRPLSTPISKKTSTSEASKDLLLIDFDVPAIPENDILVPTGTKEPKTMQSESLLDNQNSKPQPKPAEEQSSKPHPKPAERPKAPPPRPVSLVGDISKSTPSSKTPPTLPPPKVAHRSENISKSGTEESQNTDNEQRSGMCSKGSAAVTPISHSTEIKEKDEKTRDSETVEKKTPPEKPQAASRTSSKPVIRRPPPKPPSLNKTSPNTDKQQNEDKNLVVEKKTTEDQDESPVYAAIVQPVSKRPTIIRPSSMKGRKSSKDSTDETSDKPKLTSASGASETQADEKTEEQVPPIPARHYKEDETEPESEASVNLTEGEKQDLQPSEADAKPVLRTKPTIVGRPKSFSMRETLSKFEPSEEKKEEQSSEHKERKESNLHSPAPKPKPKPAILAKPRSSSMPVDTTSLHFSAAVHQSTEVASTDGETKADKAAPDRPTIIKPPAKPKRSNSDADSSAQGVSSDDSALPVVKRFPPTILPKRPASVMVPPSHGKHGGEDSLSKLDRKPQELPEQAISDKVIELAALDKKDCKSGQKAARPPLSGPARPPPKPPVPKSGPASISPTVAMETDAASDLKLSGQRDGHNSPSPEKPNKPPLPETGPLIRPGPNSIAEDTNPSSNLESTSSKNNDIPSSHEKPADPSVPKSGPGPSSLSPTHVAIETDVSPDKVPGPTRPPKPSRPPDSHGVEPSPVHSSEMGPIEKPASSNSSHTSESSSKPPVPKSISKSLQSKDNTGVAMKTESSSIEPKSHVDGVTRERMEQEDGNEKAKPQSFHPSHTKGPKRPENISKTVVKEREEVKRPDKPAPARPSAPHIEPPPELPSRPGPGHPLYHYMLGTPHGIVLHDFSGSHEDELSLKANEIVVLLRRVNESWLIGQIGNRQGIFPQDFIHMLVPLATEILPSHGQEVQWSEGTWGQETVQQFDTGKEKVDNIGKGPRCCARFDFEGGGEGDLQFEEGDYIKITGRVDEEWLRGELNGKTGLFPASFVEIIEDLESKQDTGSGFSKTPPGGGTETGSDFSKGPPGGAVLQSEENAPIHSDFKQAEFSAMALHDYRGGQGELCLKFGDYISVISKISDDWLYGELNGQKGRFPVKVIDAVPPGLPQHEGSDTHSNPKGTTEKGIRICVAVYDFGGGDPGDLVFKQGDKIEVLESIGDDWLRGRLHGKEGIFPANFVKLEEDDIDESTHRPVFTVGTPVPEDDSIITGTAIYDFEGQSDNELTFKVGDIIILGDLVPGAEEWRMGELDGQTGMFPASFVL